MPPSKIPLRLFTCASIISAESCSARSRARPLPLGNCGSVIPKRSVGSFESFSSTKKGPVPAESAHEKSELEYHIVPWRHLRFSTRFRRVIPRRDHDAIFVQIQAIEQVFQISLI